jgi:hypothetical protein
MAAAAADAMGQAFQAAAINAQLTALPIFSDNVKEDKLTAKQWLEKVILNKTGGNWSDIQTITHFRNALRGDIISWYDTITLLDDTALTWDNLKAKFERDFQAAPTTSKVIARLPELRQQDNENVNKYVSRCGIILADLKNKVSIENQEFILNDLTDGCAAMWNGLNADLKAELSLKFKRLCTKKVFSQMAGFHIIAGFKANIRSALMDKEDTLTTLDLIKAEALKIERRLEEKSKTSTNGDGSSRVNAEQINQINTQPNYDEVDAINRRNNYNSGRQNSSSPPNCNYCKKPGHIEDNCWKKNGKPNGNQSASNQPLGQQNNANNKKYTYCGMKNHTTDKCFRMIANQKKIENAKQNSKINKVDQENYENDHQSKN